MASHSAIRSYYEEMSERGILQNYSLCAHWMALVKARQIRESEKPVPSPQIARQEALEAEKNWVKANRHS